MTFLNPQSNHSHSHQYQHQHQHPTSARRRNVRSRTKSLPYAIPFFLFLLFLLFLNYAFSVLTSSSSSRATTHPSIDTSLISPQSAPHTLLSLNRQETNTTQSETEAETEVEDDNGYDGLCDSGIISRRISLLFLIPIIVFCFIGLATVTDDYFVAALEQICTRLSLSEDVAGATFMAAGSSTPEFFSAMIGTFITKDEVGIGTIVGSAVFNILVIIGLSAALAGSVLKLDWRPLIRDSSFYVLSIVLLFIFTFVSSKGVVKWWEGLILVCSYILYVLFMAYGNKPYMKFAAKLRWFGVTPETDMMATAAQHVGHAEDELEAGHGGGDGDVDATGMTSVVGNQNIHHSHSHGHGQNNNGMNDNIQGGMEQPGPRRTASQTPRATVMEDGTTRYRDLHLRTRLRAAQMTVIAIQRMKNDVRSRTRSCTDDSNDTSYVGTSVTNSMHKPTPPSTPKGTTPSSSAAQNDTEDRDSTTTIITKQFLHVDLPTTIIGWMFFPFTFIWKILFRYTIVDCSKPGNEKWWWVTFILAIIWISGVSYGMVEVTRICGCLLNIPATAMGLTVLAAGTSIPDALASISVARDGAGDMAVSNAIGSNVFDILLGLGVPWFLGDLILAGENPITVQTSPVTEVIVPIIILFSIMVAFLAILVALKWTMRPLLGYLLCGLYAVFVTYTLLDVFVFKFGK